jgi:hypothetical protein
MVELTAVGSNAAFGLLDWVLLVSIAFIWGTARLIIILTLPWRHAWRSRRRSRRKLYNK